MRQRLMRSRADDPSSSRQSLENERDSSPSEPGPPITAPTTGHSIAGMDVFPDRTPDRPPPSIHISGFSARPTGRTATEASARDQTRDKSLTPAGEDEEQDQATNVSSFGPTASGVQIQVEASGVYESEQFPDGFKFTQTIETNAPLHGASPPYVDPHPNDDGKPFYWTDAENAAHLTTFIDAPSRAAPSGGDPTYWQGTLGLNGVDESAKTVTGFDYLTYGFTLDSAGTVTPNPPQSTGGANHVGVLSGEFSDWTFS